MSDVTYEHYFYAPSEQDAKELLGELQHHGALTPDEVRPSAAGDGQWLVMAYTDYLEDEARDKQTSTFTRLAEQHHGEYDGGGAFVGTPGQAPPEPPSGHEQAKGPGDGEIGCVSLWSRMKTRLFG